MIRPRPLYRELQPMFLLILPALFAGCGGGSGAASPPVTTPAPSIVAFSATPASIPEGDTTTLTWQVTGAASVQLSDANIAVPFTGTSVVVTPQATTSYTLTASSSGGSAQATFTVTVTAPVALAGVQIDPAAPVQQIPASFLGIGHDLKDTAAIVGTSSANMNPIYEQLLKNILQYGNGPFLIRELADDNVLSYYSAADLSALSQLSSDVGAQFFVGVDFVDDDVSTASAEASLLAAGLPGNELQGLELGNEPDLYESQGDRPSGWDYSEYLSQYEQFAPALISASGGIKLAAPVWAGLSSSFMNNLDPFVASQAPTISIVTVHHYSGTACNGATEPSNYLLTEPAVDGDTQPLTGPVGISGYVSAVQRAGIPFRIGELNSINCGGQSGVSNSFSSALWAMDILFSYANAGLSGVNFFAPGDTTSVHPYTPFDFLYAENSNGTRTYSVRDINPLYYGMLLFAQAIQHGAELLPVTLTVSANVKTWATIDSSGTIRLLIIDKDQSAGGSVSIALSGYGQASVSRLLAPSYSSINGVTLGGQTFDGTPDGNPQGTVVSEALQPSAGVYTVVVPAVSAALVTIPQ